MILLLACLHPAPTEEPQPSAYHHQMEAQARLRVPEPQRGGPPFLPDASPLPPFLGVDLGISHYVGPETCGGCHAQILRTWQRTAHADAMLALEKAQSAYNPSCFRCHVTGFGHPGGYPQEKLRAVGCEACHGPGSAHALAPSRGYGALPADGSACVACHTHDQSPDFRWDSYWPQIAH